MTAAALSTTSELDIWRAAVLLAKHYGDGATARAAKRTGELLAAGDLNGQRVCIAGPASQYGRRRRVDQSRKFGGLIADTAHDVNWIVDDLDGRQAEMVITERPNRVAPRAIDRHT